MNITKDELATHGGRCSLREAIEAVDVPSKRTRCGPVSRRSNVIVLRAGRYMLSIPPTGADDNASGDLTVAGAAQLTIVGAGVGATVIDAHVLGDRVLSVAAGASLTLVGLTVTGGDPRAGAAGCAGAGGVGNGGGVASSGTLVLDTVAVTGNSAGGGGSGPGGCSSGGQGGSGGGVYSQGRLFLVDSTVSGNVGGSGGPGGAGGDGGGIYSQGRLVVVASAIYDNRAGAGGVGGDGGSGGGIFSSAGSLRLTNTTLFHNFAGAGGAGGGPGGAAGSGGSGGAIGLVGAPGVVSNATVADNGAGAGGAPGSTAGQRGAGGVGGGLFVQSSTLTLENSIVAENLGLGCAGGAGHLIVNRGHDLSYGDSSCPGGRGNPRLGPFEDNGGPTPTMATAPGSAAIDRVPDRTGDCPPTDQRGVRRPQGRACDIGAYEFALPSITIGAPSENAFYESGTRVLARFSCDEGGVAGAIARCEGSVAQGHAIGTSRLGSERFVVTAIDRSGNRTTRTIDYAVFDYVNPLREVSGLTRRRIDLGVDYAGSGPLLAIGRGLVTFASDTDSGPPSCWAISCWPGGGIVVYRLLAGPFAGKYVYVAEHLTINVRAGQTVGPGQQIATLYPGYPWSEWGWAVGPGPEALAMTDGHRCPCSDPGDWSTIDGRTMNDLLVALGAPSGYLQANTPNQSMPRGWPTWPG